MGRFLFLLVTCIVFMTGCQTIPYDALTLSPDYIAQRRMQTRKYETKDEAKMFTKCVEALQDMGFHIDESETKLGVITSSKTRSYEHTGQLIAIGATVVIGIAIPVVVIAAILSDPITTTIFVFALPASVSVLHLLGSPMSIALSSGIDVEQNIRASVVMQLVEDGKYMDVRVMFQRTIFNNKGKVSKLDGITDPPIYEEFFYRLSESIDQKGNDYEN